MSAYTGSPASEPPADGDAGIAISVVIPTYRRFELLSRCLAAIAAQDFAAEHFEIIVADDDAPSARSNLLREWIERQFAYTTGRPSVRYVPVTQTQGPAGARNRGWQEARGTVIAFTDDDTIPDRAWLSAGWAAIAEDGSWCPLPSSGRGSTAPHSTARSRQHRRRPCSRPERPW